MHGRPLLALLLLTRAPAGAAAAPDDSFDVTFDPSLGAGHGEPIDRILALVGDRLVTDSDLRLEAALATLDPSPVPLVQVRRESGLDWLVEAAVIRGLAGEVAIYQPSSSQLRDRVQRLEDQFEDTDAYATFLAEHGLDEESLAGRLYTRMVVERYLVRALDLRGLDAPTAPMQERYEPWIAERLQAVTVRLVAPASEAR